MRTNDRELGFCWGAAAASCILLAPLAPHAAALAPPCLFKSVTGLPCPTCGATHAVVALSRLEFADALSSNPLAVASCGAFLLGGLVAGAAALAGRPLREPSIYGVVLRVGALSAVILNWAYLLWHSLSF